MVYNLFIRVHNLFTMVYNLFTTVKYKVLIFKKWQFR